MSSENSRRTFLKGIGIGSVFLGSMQYTLSASDEKVKSDKNPHYGMIFDQTKCVGCSDCEIACTKVNFIPKGQHRLFVDDQTDPLDVMHRRFVRISCQQCVDSPCTEVCPTNACYKDSITSIINMNTDDCIGCKYCIVACPYDVRFINSETKAAESCNFCLDTNLNNEKDPACVEACKYDAMVFGDFNNEKSFMNKILNVKDSVRMKPNFGTKPSLRYIPALKTGV
ncbi:MAG: 4Fe-4S binding protein [Sulfurospirillum sp.]|nr:4Fe-4S binding protein [Sulfurospirillum sp.]